MSKMYDDLVQKAMIHVVKDVLKNLSHKGEFLSHEIYITFLTNYPQVKVSSKLKNMYPEKLSILLQNNFENLNVTDNEFSLSINLVTGFETVTIPFTAITQYIDQTQKFALKFNVTSLTIHDTKQNEKHHDPHILEQKENVIKVDFSKE